MYDYDIKLIKHVYGETTSGAKSSSPLSAPPQTSPAPFPKKENRFIGTKRKDKIIATNGMDLIIGNGGADVINARGGDDLIDPSRWTGGGYDVVRGGKGYDTFIIEDDYWVEIIDFNIKQDTLSGFYDIL